MKEKQELLAKDATLRDFFAAHAIRPVVIGFDDSRTAEAAYRIADAMLKEREKDE